jgi:hypothetical protein
MQMSEAQANQYLRQVGAREHRQPMADRKVYYSSALKSWIQIMRAGNGFRVALYGDCPCS